MKTLLFTVLIWTAFACSDQRAKSISTPVTVDQSASAINEAPIQVEMSSREPEASVNSFVGPVSIEIKCSYVGLIGEMALCSAIGQYADGSIADVSTTAEWKSEEASILDLHDHSFTAGASFQLKKPGSSRIKATLGDTVGSIDIIVKDYKFVSLNVQPSGGEYPVVVAPRLSAIANYDDGNGNMYSIDVARNVAWLVADESVAVVTRDDNGFSLKAMAEASVRVSAHFAVEDGHDAHATFNFRALKISELSISERHSGARNSEAIEIFAGLRAKLEGIGLFENGVSYDVSDKGLWNLTAPEDPTPYFSIESGGWILSHHPGARGTVAFEFSDTRAEAPLMVSDNGLEKISFETEFVSQVVGQTSIARVIGTWKNGETQDVTHQAKFNSSEPSILWVSNAPSDRGSTFAVKKGQTLLRAEVLGHSIEQSVTVANGSIQEIRFAEPQLELEVGDSAELSLVIVLSDESTIELHSAPYTILTSNANAVVESNGDGYHLTAIAAGSVNVSVIHDLFTQPLSATIVATEPVNSATSSLCADGTKEDDFGEGIHGCAGATTYPTRASLCSASATPCSAARYLAAADATILREGTLNAPRHNYWTDDQLGFSGSPGSCSVNLPGLTTHLCGNATPMRLCTEDGGDSYPGVHRCNWTKCRFGDDNPQNYWFGGCNSNVNAGTLCCSLVE